MRRYVSRSIVPALVAASMGLVLSAGSIAAATRNVTMTDSQSSFFPTDISIARGDSVRWKNNAGATDHDVFSTGPSKYFSSGPQEGMEPGDRYTKAFPSAGTFAYLCRVHPGMDGTVIVPMAARRITDGGAVKFKLTVASVSLSSGSPFRHVIQVDTPASGTFVDWKTTAKRSATYLPASSGTYRFRALLERTGNESRSQASPTVSVTR